jgi:carboxyl-terminal processing protease
MRFLRVYFTHRGMTVINSSDRRGLLLCVGILSLSGILGGVYGPRVRANSAHEDDFSNSVSSFSKVLDIVQQNYATPVDVERAVYSGAVPGMLRVLDPHSNFFDPRSFASLREEERGRYFGVGMSIWIARDGRIAVIDPYVDAPAFQAGLRAGDIILGVDGKSTDGLTVSDVAELLRGPRASLATVTVQREGNATPMSFHVRRDEIPRHSVELAFLLKPGIGYIRLSGFNETTDGEISRALKELDASKLDGLILDMRANPGGLLNEAIAVGDLFLDKNQLIVSYRGRNAPERRFYAIRGNQGMTFPLVVLVNNNSASATEIVTGAVQDHDRGLVVGTTTFGKGLVQTINPLSEGSGLTLTVARYYTPSGRLIQRDYKSISLYEYHYERKIPEHPTEIRQTDSGRQVTGGGGIAPDVVVQEPKLSSFQSTMYRNGVFYPAESRLFLPDDSNFAFFPERGVGGFTRFYMGTQPAVTKDFQVTDEVLKKLQGYLDAHHVAVSRAEMERNLPWIKAKIAQELLSYCFGSSEGLKVLLEQDTQVSAAVEALPQAEALYKNARRILAERTKAPQERR